MRVSFPPVETASEDGLLCVGGKLSTDVLLSSYEQGVFPWPQEGLPLLWFAPPRRGVLFFEELHVARSLKRQLNKNRFVYTFNQAFSDVMAYCARVPRPGQSGTWITDEIRRAYQELFDRGYAWSLEVNLDGRLVGGIYGVIVKGVVSGESMFSLEDNASKAGLVFLSETLRTKGIEWLDTQMITPVVERLGGREIARDEYMVMLRAAQEQDEARGQRTRFELFS